MPKARLPKRLGKEWSESELRQFFESYLKHFKSSQLQRSFIRIANTLPDRTASNVKTLYKMNRSFLSLPHIGVDTFVAIMVDRYALNHTQSLTITHSHKFREQIRTVQRFQLGRIGGTSHTEEYTVEETIQTESWWWLEQHTSQLTRETKKETALLHGELTEFETVSSEYEILSRIRSVHCGEKTCAGSE